MWVEKNIDMDGERPLATDIPTAESLALTSNATTVPPDAKLPPPVVQETPLKRDEWMLAPPVTPTVPGATTRTHAEPGFESFTEDFGEAEGSKRTLGGSVDFFSSMGTEHRPKKPAEDKPDPDKPKISSRELNTQLVEGKPLDQYTAPTPSKSTPGGPGSQWRMMRLRRVYETAEEEGKSVEEVALERFGNLDAFEEAKEERRILDEREERRGRRGAGGRGGESRSNTQTPVGGAKERFMFTHPGVDGFGSGGSSRSGSFRRPGGSGDPSTGPSAPGTPTPGPAPGNMPRMGSHTGTQLAQTHTPVPSVLTPKALLVQHQQKTQRRALSPTSLNKLQAKVLRAKLMNAPDAKKLEEEYEAEMRRANGDDGDDGDDGGQDVRTEVQVLPSLDGRGRLYDTGAPGSSSKDDRPPPPGNRRKKEKVETRDPKTGEIVRYNADDDTLTLGDMLRQEKFGAGASDQKDMDVEFAKQIMTDGGFTNDLDYIDDNAEKLGRKKMRSDAMKRQFAINDYKRTQKVLATCPFCFGEDDSPPQAPVVALGTRVYLSRTLNEELVDGHCLIVPIQHHLTMLEGDDDVWDEVKNFMKCLMRMFAEQDKGVVFYETVLSLKQQKHTFIECVPLPWEQFEEIPGYFRESILSSELEWSQHKKLIDFSARPGGFRRAMVPNLPYFMVQFDYKGEKGYGHVIEGVSEGDKAPEEEGGLDEGEKGGGEFPRYFAGEIIGNVLDIEPRKWRRPRRIEFRRNKERVVNFRTMYQKFDWTGMIEGRP
ncbi:hypothetical protein PUNSTDRAFT_82258 [Punctularia strigosozonata HHB-11173 SS5]|uniref:uncharacterized protein n=1 Tax=Punctularia strigosozonata (strain HHB-11173) TaxID=741275 RepID=UPI00044184C4|nr:uncharacterized protein PUNSTDRAFT_82258 [Punctularia strigosozonata HHB-11173 SS5]EIN12832.1 hypothetical protein PUNSTDRAFT_82258 [Punctularia strigosozonata HHB-11173 SS5]